MISVLIPNYNNAKYLAESVDSILNQTFKKTQILIYDDGSTDGSHAILKGYEKRNSRRVTVIYGKKNKGYPHAINELMRLATGEFVAFHDADDISLPERLEKQKACLIDNDLIA